MITCRRSLPLKRLVGEAPEPSEIYYEDVHVTFQLRATQQSYTFAIAIALILIGVWVCKQLQLAYGPEEFMGSACQVLEMDGTFDNIQELVYVESQLSNTSTKFYGELTQAMLALADAPGSNNGTGLMQTLAAFAIRELYEKKSAAAKNKAAEKVVA